MSQEVTELTVIRIPFQERLQAVKVDDSSALVLLEQYCRPQ
jgi:hypothetical protein